jgi:hypothetical protein
MQIYEKEGDLQIIYGIYRWKKETGPDVSDPVSHPKKLT